MEILWVGAAPGNAGGRGAGPLGAHGTRIPFGGDIAGANLEVLMASAGINRNQTFISAALNQLPARGGGEPRPAEILAPVGDYETGLELLRDTILAAGPALIIALGNVALRAVAGALHAETSRLPGVTAITRSGLERHTTRRVDHVIDLAPGFLVEWSRCRPRRPVPVLLWTTHPSAQNMSPFAGETTAFHTRMLEARAAVRAAVREVLGRPLPSGRAPLPDDVIYALPEWRSGIAPRLHELLDLWADRGV